MLKVKIKATDEDAKKLLKAGKKFVYATKSQYRESPDKDQGKE